MTRPPLRSLAPLALALALVSAACSGGDVARLESAPRGTDAPTTAPGAGAGPVEQVSWSTCRDREQRRAGMECATLAVPLDPELPAGATIDLALARLPAEGDDDERIGSLILNPGGPGGSGLEFLATAGAAFDEELRERFDLVSFDPRGVAASSPVRCVDDDTKAEQLEGDLTPDTPQELDDALADQRELLEGCQRGNADLIRHMSTADVAADLDRIRAAVGDEQLTYAGFSYGTAIGAVYATLFPERVRAMVLDGSVDPDPDWRQAAIVQATGFERVLQRFVDSCARDDRCPLGPDPAAAIAAARDSLEADPVAVDGPDGTRLLGPDQFDLGLATALYDTSTWAATADAVAELRDGGAERLLALLDRQTGRQPDGTFDNSTDARSMVNCADSPARPTLEEAQALVPQIQAAAPYFGRIFATTTPPCDGWPTAANPVPPLGSPGAPPILVVGTLGDPATPYEWSGRMAEVLPSGVLLTYEGDGHTALLTAGPCISDAVTAYLVDLEVPEDGTSCPANGEVDPFAGIRDTLVQQLADSGVPEELATCIVDGMIDEVGAERFDQLVLENDQEEITRLAAAQSLRCAAGG